jgi:glycosyltransferase involved in cell wall biosynthesis
MSGTGDVLVSVSCITYNHRAFIADALEGVCSQRSDFAFEVIVHDDASTDGTAEIVRQYAARYPRIVRPVLQTENQWSRGVNPVTTFIWPRIRGVFVALCDGDDCWTDPLKLAKQVDFLQRNPSFGGCFHPVVVKHEDGSHPDVEWPDAAALPDLFAGRALQLDDLLETNVIHAPSVLYRWRFREEPYQGDLTRLLMPFDWFLNLQHAATGPIGMLTDTMAIYRRHPGGAWWEAGRNPSKLYRRFALEYVRFFAEVSRSLGRNIPEPRLSQTLAGIVRACLLAGDVEALNQIEALLPGAVGRGSRALFDTPHPTS